MGLHFKAALHFNAALSPKLQVVFAHRRLSRHSLATADLPMGKKNPLRRTVSSVPHARHHARSCLAWQAGASKKRREACGSVVKITLILIIVFLLPSLLSAKREHPEKWYQEQWCEKHNGQVELTMPDGTRCDYVTDTHAIEFDFGSKWAEAIGQSAYYSLQTEKKPGIVLILETMKDRKYWIRLSTTIEHYNLPIDTWNVGNAAY
jgi:hypothetical protein